MVGVKGYKNTSKGKRNGRLAGVLVIVAIGVLAAGPVAFILALVLFNKIGKPKKRCVIWRWDKIWRYPCRPLRNRLLLRRACAGYAASCNRNAAG
jgi:hypothetical protein